MDQCGEFDEYNIKRLHGEMYIIIRRVPGLWPAYHADITYCYQSGDEMRETNGFRGVFNEFIYRAVIRGHGAMLKYNVLY